MERISYMEIIVRLKIFSDSLSSEQMTTMLDFKPDRAWNIGDFRPKTRYREKINGIIIDSGIERKGSIEEHTEAIMTKLEPLCSKLLLLSAQCEITLSVVYYSSYCNPGLWLDSSFIKFLSSINAGLDMDGYVLDSDDDEPTKGDG